MDKDDHRNTTDKGNPLSREVVALGLGELRVPSQEPPVTRAMLSELDIVRIAYHPRLRHDINFDPNLHFRPNLDGESGRKKVQKANDFWNCLQSQLEAFVANPVGFERELGGQEWCLRSTLQAIGEILGTLVPPEDRSAVEEILNVELLMQQFRRGVADLEKLAEWLANTLKLHCAPMRDPWVDEMATYLTVGNRKRDISLLVYALESLLNILEAMKLVWFISTNGKRQQTNIYRTLQIIRFAAYGRFLFRIQLNLSRTSL
jgi:hypothetical protein